MLRSLLPLLLVCAVACSANTHDSIEATSDAGTPDAGAPPVVSLDFVDAEQGVDLSSDGRTALLQTFDLVGSVYLYDVEMKTLTKKTESGDYEKPILGLSGDGQRVVGTHGDPFQAAIWSEADGWRDLGTPYPQGCDVNETGGWDLNADGTVAVGLAWSGCQARGFLWRETADGGEFQNLDVLGNGDGERASVISADGRVIGGFSSGPLADRTPAIWNADGSGFLLDPNMEAVGEVLSISADGTMAAGIWNTDGFYWTQADGVVNIGKFPDTLPTDSTFPNAIAADGKLIFGGCGDAWGGGVKAFVWTKATGMRPLEEIVVAQGLTVLEGYTLSNIRAASADGSVLLGTAVNDRQQQTSFVLRLPVSAYGL